MLNVQDVACNTNTIEMGFLLMGLYLFVELCVGHSLVEPSCPPQPSKKKASLNGRQRVTWSWPQLKRLQ